MMKYLVASQDLQLAAIAGARFFNDGRPPTPYKDDRLLEITLGKSIGEAAQITEQWLLAWYNAQYNYEVTRRRTDKRFFIDCGLALISRNYTTRKISIA